MRQFARILWSIMLAATAASAQEPTPIGIWTDESKLINVEIVRCGNQLCGNIVWFRWPNDAEGLPLVDLYNADPSLRTRPLLGLSILNGLEQTGARTWGGGTMYDPNNGKSYAVRMTFEDSNTARVDAYGFIPLFGETHTWTRVR